MGARLVFVSALYRAYGLTLASNLELPLPPSQEAPDLHVSFEQIAQPPHDAGPLQLVESPAEGGYEWRLLAGEECVFTALLEAPTLTITFSAAVGRKAIVEAFLHPLLGRVLRILGAPALHASVVSWEGQGIAIIGESGAGKSTLAKAFADAGAEVVSDDIAVLNLQQGDWSIPPGSGALRLLEPSNECKIFSLNELPQPPLALKSASSPVSAASPVSFRWALFLEKSSRKMELLELKDPRQKLLLLLKNSFAPRLLNRRQKQEEFSLLSRLARDVPMMTLARPLDRSLLSEQVRLITQLLSRPAKKMQGG